jgi:hypothetical protein
MLQYRWATSVLFGKWYATRAEALQDALFYGQAELDGDTIILHRFVKIEESREQEGPFILKPSANK